MEEGEGDGGREDKGVVCLDLDCRQASETEVDLQVASQMERTRVE